MSPSTTHFTYAIVGAGAAGLSLAYAMVQAGIHRQARIAIFDKATHHANDRTWCFWEDRHHTSPYPVYHQWEQLTFFAPQREIPLEMGNLVYNMIRGKDFYDFTRRALSDTGVVWKATFIQQMRPQAAHCELIDEQGNRYTADYVFDSRPPSLAPTPLPVIDFLQHFKGWIVQTAAPVFDPQRAHFMDFRVPQTQGATFVYVLPFSPTRALVEYTLFSPALLPMEAYDEALEAYMRTWVGTTEYDIVETEFGVIPMTTRHFPVREGRCIRLGTAGGNTKASTGFTFRNIQKTVASIIAAIQNGSLAEWQGLASTKFALYDATLLDVLATGAMQGRDVFEQLFTNVPAHRILRFLDNETTLAEEIAIMQSLPTLTFMKAAMRQARAYRHIVKAS